MGDSKCDRATWPLSFQMSSTGHRFWSHTLYRGLQDQPVRVLYSRTKLESEECAHEFLGEKVIGFDMEWPREANTTADSRLQQRIGLIQIACEDKIALFHIGMHSGSTAKDLLAPALRSIIEDPTIAKCGVAVLNADFARLRQWFGLNPRGAFELSHLHNLVSFGASNPAECTTKLRNLSAQVEQHLGLPLHKGNVRTGNWSQPLNNDQVSYAAADAYAGFMLFHCMNAKRMDMVPTPPLPVYAETYGDAVQGMPPKRPLQLAPVHGNARPTSVLDLYKAPGEGVEDHSEALLPPEGASGYVRIGRRGKHVLFAETSEVGADVVQQLRDQHAAEQQLREGAPGDVSPSVMAGAKPTSTKVKTAASTKAPCFLDETRTELLFQELRKHRRDLAKERKCAPFIIAHDTHLHAISRKCPRSDVELLRIHGIGNKKFADCGPAWLAIVKDLVEKSSADDAKQAQEDRPQLPLPVPTASQARAPPASNVQLDQTVRSTPTLHTGVSFSMQNASLGREKDGEVGKNDLDDQDASDESSAFGRPLREPSPSVLKRKREELEAEQKPDPERQGRLQRTYWVPPESREQPRQPSPAVPTMRPPRILATPGQHDTEPEAVLKKTPRIIYECMSAAQESNKAATPTSASTLPPATQNKIHPPPLHSTTKPEFDLQPVAKQSEPSQVQDKILRNKIIAFNKLVTITVQLPANTIDHLVNKLPRTTEELLQVPGIMPFANACSRANRDLLGFLVKSAPATRRRQPGTDKACRDPL
ncbi:hypothetical protein INS49_011789 [Diaporthe citri]|uniref:uncharacterized protein n=1 Tax=Diaporthe citri TaxID=83186 RepID=UPI001C827DEA|nr:uncharacterized protein INS49_011789 [Diaporthe citri]KAG6360724.1 hypothetical protein INS49_011789 [Diaporthe citri]